MHVSADCQDLCDVVALLNQLMLRYKTALQDLLKEVVHCCSIWCEHGCVLLLYTICTILYSRISSPCYCVYCLLSLLLSLLERHILEELLSMKHVHPIRQYQNKM